MRHLLWGTSSKMVVNVNALLKVLRCQACKETMRKQRCGLVTSSDLFITKRKHSCKYVWSGKGRLIWHDWVMYLQFWKFDEEVWDMKYYNTNTVEVDICQWVWKCWCLCDKCLYGGQALACLVFLIPGSALKLSSCLEMWNWIRFIVAVWPPLLVPFDLKLPTVKIVLCAPS